MFSNIFYYLISTLITALGLFCAAHALLHKRNPGAALSWIMACLVLPLLGPVFYYLFGINRIQRKAIALKHPVSGEPQLYDRGYAEYCFDINAIRPNFQTVAKLSAAISGQWLLCGNDITLLQNGENLYPRMLADIQAAQHNVLLSTYIFDTDTSGRMFIDALNAAQRRGIHVKVLIDSYGEAFQYPWASTLLKRANVDTACFLPIFPIPRINLRNHKKILCVDGTIAYTGGMNISHRHMANDIENSQRVIDTHFRLSGPIVKQIENEFIHDWHFVTGEHLNPTPNIAQAAGNICCRTLSDGPDNDMDIFIETFISAFAVAQDSIKIITPYFIPTPEIIASLNAAAMRGVEVRIILPGETDLPYTLWASRKILPQFLRRGVKIYYQPPPFVHTKLLLVDDYYAQIGSVNIDPRSLKLNFEMAVEIYHAGFGHTLNAHFEQALQQAQPLSEEMLNARPLPIKLRDAFAWLFSPYL